MILWRNTCSPCLEIININIRQISGATVTVKWQQQQGLLVKNLQIEIISTYGDGPAETEEISNISINQYQ